MFQTRYRYIYIVLIAVYSYGNTLFTEVYRYYHISVPPFAVILAFLIVTSAIWEGDLVIQRLLERYGGIKNNYRRLVLNFLISVAWSAGLSAAIFYAAAHWIYQLSGDPLSISVKLGITLGTRLNLFLQVLHVIFFFFRQYRDKQLEAEELKRVNAQAQLQAIKNQVNPHFLFNNLNVLSTLILLERPEANAFIEEFSMVYRHVLNSQQHELVTVGEELEFMNHYIFLLSHRFPRSIYFDIRIEAVYHDWLIVPVALQMLVENAIKHNVVSTTQPLKVEIYVDAYQRLVVTNNLQPRATVEASTRIGLSNIGQRYELISRQSIIIQSTKDTFSVILPLIKTFT